MAAGWRAAPRRDAHQRRCSHGRDLSCPRRDHEDDPRLGTPMCPDCYDYTGHVMFNGLAPELWRRFVIYLPSQLARLAGITQRQLRREVRVRFVKVAEYQHRGIIHYHAVIRLDAPSTAAEPLIRPISGMSARSGGTIACMNIQSTLTIVP